MSSGLSGVLQPLQTSVPGLQRVQRSVCSPPVCLRLLSHIWLFAVCKPSCIWELWTSFSFQCNWYSFSYATFTLSIRHHSTSSREEVFNTLGPCIVNLINSSLRSGCVPVAFKHAAIQPLLKKTNLDTAVLSNFRPISKLPFLSKVLEKVVYITVVSWFKWDLRDVSVWF